MVPIKCPYCNRKIVIDGLLQFKCKQIDHTFGSNQSGDICILTTVKIPRIRIAEYSIYLDIQKIYLESINKDIEDLPLQKILPFFIKKAPA
jgi:hypothetical protein